MQRVLARSAGWLLSNARCCSSASAWSCAMDVAAFSSLSSGSGSSRSGNAQHGARCFAAHSDCSTSGSGSSSSAATTSSFLLGQRHRHHATPLLPAAAAAAAQSPLAASSVAQQQARAYATRRPHRLSIRKANNKATRLAVAEVLGPDWREGQEEQKGNKGAAAADDVGSSSSSSSSVGGDKKPAAPKADAAVVDSAVPPLPAADGPADWTRVGRVCGPYAPPQQDAFAVVEIGPFQYKVTPGDVVLHPKLRGANIDDVLSLGRVLLVGTRTETAIGRPYLPTAAVAAAVESHFRDTKVHVFKKQPRKRYSKLKGHRSQMTALRVLQIFPGGMPARLEWSADAAAAAAGQSAVLAGASAASAASVQAKFDWDVQQQQQQQRP